jgi:hypothetical protein
VRAVARTRHSESPRRGAAATRRGRAAPRRPRMSRGRRTAR